MLLGRQLRDGIPQQASKYRIHQQWESYARLREKTFAEEQIRNKDYHDIHQIKHHKPLTVGQEVACQNVRNRKWDRTGTIVEDCGNRQYRVKINGSGRSSLRTRTHLKPLLHIRPQTLIISSQHAKVVPPPTPSSGSSSSKPSSTAESPSHMATSQSKSSSQLPSASESSGSSSPRSSHPIPRRSSRQRNAPDRYGEWTT